MHIGFDAKRAFLNNTGLGNYSRWLISGLATQFPEHQYTLYTPYTKNNQHLAYLQQLRNTRVVPPSGFAPSAWWRTTGIISNLKHDGVNIYHGLSHELPLGIKKSGVKSVLTVHDLIFLRFPQYYKWIDRLIYQAKIKYACSAADRIIAVSEKTKQDLIELLQIDASKIEVVYQDCDPAFKLHQSEAQKTLIRKKYNLPKRFLLSVGTIEERKNLLLLIKALPHTRGNEQLFVIGKPKAYFEEVKNYLEAHQLTDRVTFLREVTFQELPAFYQMATVFVYPSRYEGFGIPILEALYSGVPVIAAKGSCLEEAGGPHSLYVDPDDELDLAKKINKVWNTPALRQEMMLKGFEYCYNFNNEKLAAQLIQVYQKTLSYA
ncbi:glycosyltransferase family 1 protein [Mucilaginibacter sp. CSA2-8R]|uniref:glycosyltransferase family 4 protein n=1 Tax=Mucilaginibacter sp. CSA2-8R TaxID=3141542 RepID=UPI00315E0011